MFYPPIAIRDRGYWAIFKNLKKKRYSDKPLRGRRISVQGFFTLGFLICHI